MLYTRYINVLFATVQAYLSNQIHKPVPGIFTRWLFIHLTHSPGARPAQITLEDIICNKLDICCTSIDEVLTRDGELSVCNVVHDS